MNGKRRWLWLGFVLLIALLLNHAVVLAQSEADMAEAIRIAQSFDRKFMLDGYIAQSAMPHIAQRALAMHDAMSFDQKYALDDYIAYSGIETLARRALAVYNATPYDRPLTQEGSIARVPATDLMAQELAEQELTQAQFTQALVSEVELHDRFAEAECFDQNFFTEGHIICREQAAAEMEELDPS